MASSFLLLCVVLLSSVRELGCNEPMTDGASLRRRQEDLWQGLDAAIKSQEMYRASPPPSVTSSNFFPLSRSPLPFSFRCFVPSPCRPTRSSSPHHFSPSIFLSFARSPIPPLLITPPYSRPCSGIVSQCIKRMDKITPQREKKNDFTFLKRATYIVCTFRSDNLHCIASGYPHICVYACKSRACLVATTVCKYRVERYYC